MDKLRSGEYSLSKGDVITARVRAKNNKGWSEFSKLDTSDPFLKGILIKDSPGVLNTPKFQLVGGGVVRVYWTLIDGQDNVNDYSVH